jgi:hypothetical protein
MTNSFEYRESETEFDPTACSLSECRNWNRTWDTFPHEKLQPRDKYFFQLFHHVARKIVEHLSLRHLAVFVAVATHANGDGVCEPAPSSRTIGKLVGMRDERTVSRYIRDLEGDGWLERQRVGWKRWRITVVRTDGARDYTQVDRRWLCRDLSTNGIGLALLLAAVANGRSSFVTERKVLEKMSGLSRNSLASLLSEIENQGLVRLDRGISNTVVLDLSFLHWTLPKKSRSSPNFAQKVAPEEYKGKNLEEHKDFKNLEDKSNTRVKHDQRRAKTRADAVATIPTILPLEDQKQTPSAVVSQESYPPTHDKCTCDSNHFLEIVDEKGKRYMMCRRWLACVKYQMAVEKEAAEEAEKARLRTQCGTFFGFSDMFARPSAAPALPPAPIVIEGEWQPAPRTASAEQMIAVEIKRHRDQSERGRYWEGRYPGEPMSTAMYRELWERINHESHMLWDRETRKRASGMMRTAEIARFGVERFHQALRDSLPSVHFCDDGDGGFRWIDDPKELLNLVGNAIKLLLRDSEHFGRNPDNNCPNPVYQRMFAA